MLKGSFSYPWLLAIMLVDILVMIPTFYDWLCSVVVITFGSDGISRVSE